MIHYGRILQTGMQSLLAVACGWGCGRWHVVSDAEATVAHTNALVLRFCIPCLQVWLLACKTDMQQADNWWALAAFLLWSVSLQALLAAHQLLHTGRLQLDRLGVDGLILTTNNTGILGPVVLEAAVGPRLAPLGMLATVVLYFQQLPLAQLLFQLQHQQQHGAQAGGLVPGPAGRPRGVLLSKVSTSPLPHLDGGASDGDEGDAAGRQGTELQAAQQQQQQRHHQRGGLQQLHHIKQTGSGVDRAAAAASGNGLVMLGTSQAALQQQQQRRGSAGSLQALPHQQQARDLEQPAAAAGAGGAAHEAAPLLQQQQQHHALQHAGAASHVASLLLKNPLVWSTGVAVLLSALGSSALLDPASPRSLGQLAFVEGVLAWFAQTTAPLTLFTTGLWMWSNGQEQQQEQQEQQQQLSLAAAGEAAAPQLRGRYGSTTVAAADVLRQLLLRATLAPAMMVAICWLMGFQGDLAHALVILALLPVAQTAFVICKQAETGMAAVSAMLVASLLVMLPQLMLVLALLERLHVFAPSTAASVRVLAGKDVP